MTSPRTEVTPQAGFWQRFAGPAALGMCGALGLLAIPLTPAAEHALHGLPTCLRVLAIMGNSVLLVLTAAALGAWFAHQVGLRSVLAGTQKESMRTSTVLLAVGSGLVLGALIGWLDMLLVQRQILPELPQLQAQQTLSSRLGSALYGGLTEEVLLRWGLMSLIAWTVWRVSARRHPRLAVGVAIVLAAAVFAISHLPVLAAQTELHADLLLRTLVYNAMAGLLYGWWFYRRDLETAVLAHAASHLGMCF